MKSDIELGRRLAKKFPPPKIIEHNGVRIVTLIVDGLSAHELAALSDYYRYQHGDRQMR